MNNKNATTETVEEEVSKTVIKDNTLDIMPVGTTVYIPYLSVTDNVYEVRECVIESIGDIIENNVITIYYKCKVSSTDEKINGDTMTLNILANISTSYEEAKKELDKFLKEQIDSLKEHSEAIKKQLKKNSEHIRMFEDKIK